MKNLNGLLAVLAVFLFASFSFGQQVPIRVNAGGTAVSYGGNSYSADTGFNSGSVTFDRPQTGLPEPFQSFRFDRSFVMNYAFQVPDGNYTVNLHFAELWFGATGGGSGGVGSRVFDINIEGQLVQDNFDVFAEAGANASVMKTYNATVSGGEINIDFDSRAEVGGERHPVINAIEIFQASTPDNQAPNTPSGLTVSSFDHESANISWNPSSDNGGGNVVGYNIYNNGSQIKTTMGTSANLTGLQANTPHQISVAAYDNASTPNVSDRSSSVPFITANTPGSGSGNYNPDFALRINAGDEYGIAGTFDNKVFVSDSHAIGGTGSTNTSTGLSQPYVSERYGGSRTMSYNIPVEDGQYQVILNFAELHWGATGGGSGGIGSRVFDVIIEDDLKLDNYDIFEEVGAETSVRKPFFVIVDGGELNIEFSSLGTGGAGHPQISAIEILGSNFITDPTDPTDPTTPGTSLWSQSTVDTNNIFYTKGNVGIGTADPGSQWKLAVNGHIRAKEIKVETDWADYVFLNDYKLPTLAEVEQHIQDKGHLINIPSAAEVEANGIKLGEMNKLLLEKIEELTLYILEQDKAQKELETRLDILEKN